MTHEIASPELAACEVHGVTRSAFILRGALAAGAFYGTSAVAPFVSQAFAATGGGDAEILNFALTLEYLEADFYNVKGKAVGLSGQAKRYAKEFGAEESAHVLALTAAIKQLGGKPVAKPTSAPTTERARRCRASRCSRRPEASCRSRLATRRPSTC